MGYHIIGDIHGQADKLELLLGKLGYGKHRGLWSHPDNTAIFVGDFIDQGPRQIETVGLVRRMVEEGKALAVMGNHEFNAIAWWLRDPKHPSKHLRTRCGKLGRKNFEQHAAFLHEVRQDSPLHEELVSWFLTLPLWLDERGLRVVHACWHPEYMKTLLPMMKERRLTRDLMAAASTVGSVEFQAVEGLTKGLEIDLPSGCSFVDKHGQTRSSVRLKWWDPAAVTFRQAALNDEIRSQLPETPIPDDCRISYDNVKPLFFGHYWATGAPKPLSPHVACVDYSAGEDGPLVAYRWDGEPALDAASFVTSH